MILDCFKDGELVESIQLSASKRLYTVGRQANVSDIFLSHGSISREQATLTVSASGSVVVMDVGSAQGTFISGKKLPPKKKHTLPPGRSLVFGKSTRIYKLREGASGFMNDVEAVPVPKQQKRYNETLATALLSVLRRGSLDDSERLRPDGYVPLAALLASSALASFRCTEKEARTLVADTEALELFELRTEGGALLMRAQSGHEARRLLPPQASARLLPASSPPPQPAPTPPSAQPPPSPRPAPPRAMAAATAADPRRVARRRRHGSTSRSTCAPVARRSCHRMRRSCTAPPSRTGTPSDPRASVVRRRADSGHGHRARASACSAWRVRPTC
jgi:pSer/pThr/pTyr-binding forkhead associated (FHA) protein